MAPGDIRRAYEAKRAYDEVMIRRPIYDSSRLAGFLSLLTRIKDAQVQKGPSGLWQFQWEKGKAQVLKPNKMTNEEYRRINQLLDGK